MSSTESQVRDLLHARKAELSEEQQRIDRALEALGVKPLVAEPTKSRPKTTRKRSKGRSRKGKPIRADQAVDIVSAEPGIKGGAIAKKMKIKPNYLYRVLNGLVNDGRLKKDGLGYYPVTPVTPKENGE